jgi:hypothetical protein
MASNVVKVNASDVAYAAILPWLAGAVLLTLVQLPFQFYRAWYDPVRAGMQPPILGTVALTGLTFALAGTRPHATSEGGRWIVAALVTLVALADVLILGAVTDNSEGPTLWAGLSGYFLFVPAFVGLALRRADKR